MTRRSLLPSVLSSVAAGVTAAKAFAQERKRISPHETASITLSGKTVTITYGRPYLKGRTVGDQVAPFGKVWRLGADEATQFTITGACKFGSLSVPAGSYALFAIPSADKWTMIVNKTADQWGAFNYDEAQDLGRFTLNVTNPHSPIEEFTIAFAKETASSAAVSFSWGTQMVATTVQSS